VALQPSPISGSIDPDHTHGGFEKMCDPDPATFTCKIDGAWKAAPAGASYAYLANPALTNSDGSHGHLLDPYLTLAKDYGWANFMFQTNQGPSYPAHQFMFAGTSAPTVMDDARSRFVAENFDNMPLSFKAGCLAPADSTSALIEPAFDVFPTPIDPGLPDAPAAECTLYNGGAVQECTLTNSALVFPTNPVGTFCYPHSSMADILDPNAITWKYYAPSAGSIWTAPDSIKAICEPGWVDQSQGESAGLECKGQEWNANVDVKNLGTDILRDIASCDLARVNWVIPDGEWSDHPGPNSQYGPAWVAAVVNAIGNNPKCPAGTKDAGQKYWENTAIVITWDDWGGWSDHELPRPRASQPCTLVDCHSDYEVGFRVPLIMVSAYTPAGFINNDVHDFGSVLRMIEGINHLEEGALGFADKRSTTDLNGFFPLNLPREYHTIPAQVDASFFLSQDRAPVDPDVD
jgi:phospholipase C